MRKQEQILINEEVQQALEDFRQCNDYQQPIGQLRSCTASVFKTGKYFYLVSYRTIIAIIDTTTDTLYDFLRLVYGYTSTSAQHIAKFDHDYGNGKWGCAHRLTYREV